MLQNPFEISEVARMQRLDQEKRLRQHWELGLDKLDTSHASRWTNFAWTIGSFVVVWLGVWVLSF